MPSYTIVNAAGGPVRVLHVPGDEAAQAQLQADEFLVAGLAPPDTYRSGDAWVPRPARPSDHHTWTAAGWTAPLEALKEAKRAAINAARDAEELSPITWDGSVFDADRDSLLRIMGAVAMVQAGVFTSQTWTLADNTTRTMAAGDMAALFAAIGQRTGVLHATARTRKAAVDAATTAAEIDAA